MAKTKKTKKKTTAKKKIVKSKSKTKAKAKKKKAVIKRGKGGLFVKGTKGGGNKTTLTTAIAMQLARMWRHKIADNIACDVIGITYQQLRRWINTNQVISVTMGKTDKAGNTTFFTESIGLQTLRARERGTHLLDYMEKYKTAIDSALSNEQYKAALGGMQFLMEKQWPKVFGKEPGGEDEDKPKAVRFPLAPPPSKGKSKSKPPKKSKK